MGIEESQISILDDYKNHFVDRFYYDVLKPKKQSNLKFAVFQDGIIFCMRFLCDFPNKQVSEEKRRRDELTCVKGI